MLRPAPWPGPGNHWGGNMDYDASNASAPFSSFIVQWDGLPYDLTGC